MRSPASTVLLWEDAVRVVYLCAHCGRPLANWPAQAQGGTDGHSRPRMDAGSLAIGETDEGEGGLDD